MADPPNILLASVVGSAAYGLAGPGSDIDRLGVFAAPTIAFHATTSPAVSPHRFALSTGKICT